MPCKRLPDGRLIAGLSEFQPVSKCRLMSYSLKLSPPQFPYPQVSDWGEDRHGLWQAFTYQGIRLAFRWIPPGCFMMGSNTDEPGRFDNEDLHPVTLSKGFWLAETTVTQALWQAVMGSNPSDFKGEQRPVEKVSYENVSAFIQQLELLVPNLLVRLPWEAEWEYACRAGRQTPFNFAGELTLDKVNYRGIWKWSDEEWGEGAKQQTAEVKSYPCNDWGLYEMHGNVWEWCEDVWKERLGFEAVVDPWQSSAVDRDSARVVRGGSWSFGGGDVRSAYRSRSAPDFRNDDLGFRLALGHASQG